MFSFDVACGVQHVDNRFGFQTRNSCAADMVDGDEIVLKHIPQQLGLLGKLFSPTLVIRMYFDFSHDRLIRFGGEVIFVRDRKRPGLSGCAKGPGLFIRLSRLFPIRRPFARRRSGRLVQRCGYLHTRRVGHFQRNHRCDDRLHGHDQVRSKKDGFPIG